MNNNLQHFAWCLLIGHAGVMMGTVAQDLQQTEEETLVKVFSFQRGLWEPPSDNVFLRYNFSKDQEPLNVISVCYWIRFEMLDDFDFHLSYKNRDNNKDPIYFGNTGNVLNTWFDSAEQKNLPTWNIIPETWRHLCHVFEERSYTIYSDGKKFHKGDLAGNWPLYVNGSLVLGQEQDNLGGGFDVTQVFQGDISQMSFWDYALDHSYVRDMANCRIAGSGNIFSLNLDQIENVNVDENMVKLKNLCRSADRYIAIHEEIAFDEALEVCGILNATIIVPGSNFQNQEIVSQSLKMMDVCQNAGDFSMWLGVHYEGNWTWRNVDTKQKLNYSNHRSETIFQGVKCMSLTELGIWQTSWCDIKRCTACHVQSNNVLYLRGLCFKQEHLSLFQVQGYINGRYYFKGMSDNIIYWEEEANQWVLASTSGNATVLKLSKEITENPIGLAEWEVVEEICHQTIGHSITLGFSPCNRNQYMCSSGHCIPLESRCNIRQDCRDGSDEINCQIVFSLGEFTGDIPPQHTSGAAVTLIPSIEVTRIADIDDINMAISIELTITITWIDDRLEFKHLKSKNGTILPTKELEKVWKPNYLFTNLWGGHLKVLAESLSVSSANNATVSSFNSIDRDVTYPASTNTLTLVRRHLARITCNFDLYIYPFDNQHCSIDIELPPELNGYVQFSINETTSSYTGPLKLSAYSVNNVRYKGFSGSQGLRVEFGLHRLLGVVFVSTFIPSAMLLIISWATLFIEPEDLNVRAVMSLTTLLVLYTLFSNMSRSLPNTASTKLIDIWFFVIIFLLFLNILMHILTPKHKGSLKKIKVGSLDNKFALKGNDTHFSFRFIKFYRIFGLPVIVLVFNIVFWSIVVSNKIS